MRAKAAGVDDALRNALMIEIEDFLAEMLVFNKGGAALTGLERVLVVGNRGSLLGRQGRNISACRLVKFSTGSAHYFLIADADRFQLAALASRHVALQLLLNNGSGSRTWRYTHAKHPEQTTLG